MKHQITIKSLPSDVPSLDPPFEEDYALLLIIGTTVASAKQRYQIALNIVNSRCQYVVTFGHDCELWHDSIDESCQDDTTPHGRFLMTTWHDNEPLDDVVDFFWWNTSYADFESERLAVILIGAENELEQALRKRLDHLTLQ